MFGIICVSGITNYRRQLFIAWETIARADIDIILAARGVNADVEN